MANFWKKLRHSDGIFSVLAIMIIGIAALILVNATYSLLYLTNTLRESINIDTAQGIADSVIEYLQYMELPKYDSGYNSGKITCKYAAGQPASDNPAVCAQQFDYLVFNSGFFEFQAGSNDFYTQKNEKDVKIEFEIKGRADKGESLKTEECGNDNNHCYTVPFPGTGNAGGRCDMYTPSFVSAAAPSANVPPVITGVRDYAVDQLDYSCNWGRMRFGGKEHSIAIPLYYEEENGKILNTFKNGLFGHMFKLRVRTPCLPCVYKSVDVKAGVNRLCASGQDETVCKDTERYRLKDGGKKESEENEIVAQWNLNGVCTKANGEEETGSSDFFFEKVLG